MSAHSRSEDFGQVGHGLDEITDRRLFHGLAFNNGRDTVTSIGTSRVKDKGRRLVNVGKLVAVIGEDIRFLNQQPLQDSSTDRLRETTEIGAVLFPLGETILADEIGGVGEESAVVFPIVVTRHISVATSTLEEGFEIVIGVSVVPTQMRVTVANVAFELCEGGVGVRGVCHTWDILPGVSLDTGIMSGPLDCVGVIQTGSPSELLDIFKEFVESRRVGGESRSLAAMGHRHGFNSSHD